MYKMPSRAGTWGLPQGLLKGGENKELQQRFEALVSFLRSPESKKLGDESERHLAEGKQVTVRIRFENGKPKYELKVD